MSALFRVVTRYVGNLAPMPGVFPDYPAPVLRNTETGRELSMMRWGGTATAPRRAAGHQHPQRVITALARLAEAEEPALGPSEQLRGVRTRAEPGNQEKGRGVVRIERGPSAVRLRWHLDDVQR